MLLLFLDTEGLVCLLPTRDALLVGEVSPVSLEVRINIPPAVPALPPEAAAPLAELGLLWRIEPRDRLPPPRPDSDPLPFDTPPPSPSRARERMFFFLVFFFLAVFFTRMVLWVDL